MSEKLAQALAWPRRFDGIVERIVSAETGGPTDRLEPDRLSDLYLLAQDAACESWCEEISDDAWVHAARSRVARVARS